MYECMVITYTEQSTDQPGKVANPARGQPEQGHRLRLIIWSSETGSAVPSRVSPLILHTQAKTGAFSRDPSRFSRRRHSPFIHTTIRHRASPELSGHAIDFRRRFFFVCVCFLPIHSGPQVRWTYQPGSHRRKVTHNFSSTFLLRCVP